MHFSTATFLATFAASAAAYSATARTFAVNHFYGNGPLVSGRMDPIISPGTASGHVHVVQGGNGFALNMTIDQAEDSTCTSALVKNDKSNYWTPSLYFVNPNGTFTSVPMFYMNVYYFFEATTDIIKAFQPGHRMVIGNPELRSPPATGGISITDLADGTPQPVQWVCPRSETTEPLYPTNSDGLHGVGIQDPTNAGAGVGFPDQNCDGYASPLRADIHFPSCYNPAYRIDDYKNNMVWPTNGNCPPGYTHTPHLFYEVYWNTPLFADQWTPGQGNQPFVLSNGDPTGYSLHADFISGWDQPTLQQIIDNCDAGDSGMDKCPGLIGGLNDPSSSCNIVCPIDETIFGTLDALPGNVPLGQWGVAPGGSSSPATTSAVPIESSTTATSAASTDSPVPTTSEASVISAASGRNSATTSPATSEASVISAASGGNSATTSPTAGGLTQASLTASPVDSGGSNIIVTSYVTDIMVVWTTVTVAGAAPTASSSGSPVAAGWSYYGCYLDFGQRAMTGIEFVNIGQHAVTNTNCVAYCSENGYSLAGTEYGGQCFCANSLSSESSLLDGSKCDMPCEGDATQTCGGSWALSVYSKSSSNARRSHNRHLRRHILGLSN